MKKDWQLIVSFKTELISEYLIQRGYEHDLRILLPKIGFLTKRMNVANDIYQSQDEIDKIKSILDTDLSKIARESYSVIKNVSFEYLAAVEVIQAKCSHDLDREEMAELFEIFCHEFQRTASMIGVPTIIDMVVESNLRDVLKAKNITNIDHLISDLARPSEELLMTKANIELGEIRDRAKSFLNNSYDELLTLNPEIAKQVSKHASKYGWIHSTLFLGDLYNEQKVWEDLQNYNSAKLDLPIQSKDSKFDDEVGLIKLFQESIYYRTARLEWLNVGCYRVRPLFEQIAKELSITFEELIYCLPEEILSSLRSNREIDKGEIEKRIDKYALVSNGEDYCKLYVGQDVDKLKDEFANSETTEEVIKGLVACKGIAKGRVVLVMDRTDLAKVKDGDIMIAKLTTPDFVVAIKKARAVVTDLGGMTSHAAIVSRELNMPCIVGTKIATKLLRDGDMVEVDANNGIVKKLS